MGEKVRAIAYYDFGGIRMKITSTLFRVGSQMPSEPYLVVSE